MTINIFQGNQPIGVKGDVNVIIDVIRAFTTTYVAFQKGIEKIFLVNEVEKAMQLRNEHPELILVGEINALPIEGFDYTNSPKALDSTTQNLQGKNLVHKTTNGVKAILNNLNANHIFATGFTNADALVQYLQKTDNLSTINLIASHPSGDEDLACAQYIKARLLGNAVDTSNFLERVTQSEAAQKFYTKDIFDEADIHMAANIDSDANFVMEVQCHDELPYLKPVYLTSEISPDAIH